MTPWVKPSANLRLFVVSFFIKSYNLFNHCMQLYSFEQRYCQIFNGPYWPKPKVVQLPAFYLAERLLMHWIFMPHTRNERSVLHSPGYTLSKKYISKMLMRRMDNAISALLSCWSKYMARFFSSRSHVNASLQTLPGQPVECPVIKLLMS